MVLWMEKKLGLQKQIRGHWVEKGMGRRRDLLFNHIFVKMSKEF